MDDILLADTIERYIKGEMNDSEKTYFEEMRQKNPELDQQVVEQIFFLAELNKYSSLKNFKHSIHETVSKLVDEGLITKNSLRGTAKIIYLWNKHKRTIAVAASIAGIVSIFSASTISFFSNNKNNNIKPLVEKIKEQDDKYKKLEKEIGKLNTNSITPKIVKPRLESKFRATGFLIDANNNFIVTNAHVLNEAPHQLVIENSKGEQFKAISVYVNTDNDLAIIKVIDEDFKRLPAPPYSIRKGHTDLGEQIYTLGFPKQEIVYGEGYVSAKNGYNMDSVYCQLSTSVNEGNSGSPVINKRGEVIGIISSRETNAEGVVFAVKSSNVYNAIEEVRKNKEYEKIRITSNPSLKGTERVGQIKKVEDYIFMIKGN